MRSTKEHKINMIGMTVYIMIRNIGSPESIIVDSLTVTNPCSKTSVGDSSKGTNRFESGARSTECLKIR